MEKFLQTNPKMKGKIVLLQIAVPSRGEVPGYQKLALAPTLAPTLTLTLNTAPNPEPNPNQVPGYQKLRSNVHKLVSRINGEYGTLEDVPIHYLDQSMKFEELCALYFRAEVMFVTSLRDGNPTPTPTPTPIPNRGIHRMGAVLARLLGLNVRALRILGSTALCLAWVAAGRASVCQHAQTQTARLGSVPTRGSSRQLAAAQGSCASSGRARRLCAARPHHWAPSHCLGCPSWPPPNQPADSTAVEHAGLLRGPAQARLPQAVGLVRWPRDRLRCRRSLRAARQ